MYLKFGHLILTALFVVHNFHVSVVWTLKIGTMWFVTLQACLSHHLAGCSWSHVCLACVHIITPLIFHPRPHFIHLSPDWRIAWTVTSFGYNESYPSEHTRTDYAPAYVLCFYFPWVHAVSLLGQVTSCLTV